MAFERFLKGDDVPAPFGVLSIVANFPEQLLDIAVWGHAIVATARLAGFRVLRNTYRPLSSRTIAEFWNRYYYFFKEILVNVYFYPTYVRCFKRHPRLRLAFATFMAAGVGNFFFHILLDVRVMAEAGLIGTLKLFQTYAFYCVVLAGGIVISQLRARRPDRKRGLAAWAIRSRRSAWQCSTVSCRSSTARNASWHCRCTSGSCSISSESTDGSS